MAVANNLYLDQGSDYSILIDLQEVNGRAINLTGATVRSQMRKSFGSSLAYSFLAEVIEPLSGRIRLSLTSIDSSVITPGRYVYDIDVTFSNGRTRKVREGLVLVEPEVTTGGGTSSPPPGGITNLISAGEFTLVSTDGQTTITFPAGQDYFPNTNALFIFIDGVALPKSGYLETNNKTVQLVTPLAANRSVLVKYLRYLETSNTNFQAVANSNSTPPSGVNGLLYYDPATENFSVYSEAASQYKSFLYQNDLEVNRVLVPLDGGKF